MTIVLGIVLLTACVLCAFGSAATTGSNREFFFNCALIAGLAGGFFLLLRGPTPKEPRSLSVIALISEFRAFASEVVYRLRQGAIGGTQLARGRVVVCIDELDKIVDFTELRAALRRIKTVFEVEGCYYVLSLAEDALRKLYLGAIDGKTEVDSALDHVVALSPLPKAEVVRIVAEYLTTLGEKDVDERTKLTIASLSFGVSRDALRVADEWHAARPRKDAIGLVQSWRRQRLQYSDALEPELREKCAGDAPHVTEHLRVSVPAIVAKASKTDGEARAKAKVLVVIWAVTLLELTLSEGGDLERIAELCMRCGYAVGDDRLEEAVKTLCEAPAPSAKKSSKPPPAVSQAVAEPTA